MVGERSPATAEHEASVFYGWAVPAGHTYKP